MKVAELALLALALVALLVAAYYAWLYRVARLRQPTSATVRAGEAPPHAYGHISATVDPHPLPPAEGGKAPPEPLSAWRARISLSSPQASSGPVTSAAGPTYRTRHVDLRPQRDPWNPYDPGQSREQRVRQAGRRRARRVPEDYYTILGTTEDATPDEVERAYRRAVARIHPDKFHDDPPRRAQAEAKLRQLNAIIEVLRDPSKRARYDARTGES